MPTAHRILVVDDNQAIHDDIRKILLPQPSGGLSELESVLFGTDQAPTTLNTFEIDSAYDGERGLLCIRQALADGRPYAMAFVDVRMPVGPDGIETIGHAFEVQPDLQVVICTAYSDYSFASIAKRFGHRDNLLVLKKPFDNMEVIQMAHALCRKWELHRQDQARLYERTRDLERACRDLKAEIDGHKETAAELRRARDTAEQATRAKSEFLAMMSHEIRTPMNGIIGLVDLVLESSLAPAQREHLQMIRESSSSLLSIINDILDFSKIEAGRLDLSSSAFSLRDVIEQTLSALSVRADEKSLELVARVGADVPDALLGDPGRLRQVILNLAGNAVKFTARGEVVINVRLLAIAPASVELRFEVEDTGIGIAPDDQKRVFQAFEQVHGTATRRQAGTGLGLAISARLVSMMGGQIGVQSELGKGSRFWFTASFGRTGVEAVREVRADLKALRILVVDDNPTNLAALGDMLRSWHMEPILASSAEQALELLERGPACRLALLDAVMPGMDGFALAERLITLAGPAVLMMMPASARLEHQARGQVLGLSGSVTKPIRQSVLLEAIVEALHLPAEDAQVVAPREQAFAPLSILVAEDNLINMKLAQHILVRAGHRVTTAENGLEVIDKISKEKFDIILMDVQMPDMDGFEATAAIRKREASEGLHTPIIAMTALAMQGDEQRCLDAGMDAYIPKPINARALLEIIQAEVALARPEPAPIAALRKRLGGDEALIFELISDFAAQTRELLPAMRRAVAEGDHRALERAAHRLKGSAADLGDPATVDAASEIERLGREGHAEEARPAIEALAHNLERFFKTLEKTRPE